mgnify:CR=1 FL=1
MNKIFSEVCNFKYKNAKYKLFVDSNNRIFFLKSLSNNQLSYVTEEELVELQRIFCKKSLAFNVSKNKVSFIPKIISLASATAIVLTLQSCKSLDNKYTYGNINSYDYDADKTISYTENDIPSLEDSIATAEEKTYKEGKLVVDDVYKSDLFNYIYVYDLSYLDEALGNKKSDVTATEIKQMISNNNEISAKYKELLYTFTDNLVREYPDVDLRVFYENLKTLAVVECDKNELMINSLSADSSGCYRKDRNKIYVLKDYVYEPGTWDYQVIMHEFSHVLKSGNWDINDKNVVVSFESVSTNGEIIGEALNSIFAVRMYDKDEQDIAYQLQSNYLQLILENMDNYKLDDFINKSFTYFESKLNECNNNDDAVKIMTLIKAQYTDYHDDSIEIEQKEFYPIYDYIANMVYRNNLYADMSYDEAKNVCDYMISRMTFDVPTEYNIDIEHIYQHFNEYCTSLGISNSLSR